MSDKDIVKVLSSDDDKVYPEPPPGIQVLSNGAGRNKGGIVYGPGTFKPDPHRITPETSLDLNRHRWNMARETAMDGMGSAVKSVSGATGWDAWKEINRTQAEIAMDKEFGRASTEAAKFVGNAAQLLPDRRRASQDADQPGNITVSIPPDALMALVEAARRRADGE